MKISSQSTKGEIIFRCLKYNCDNFYRLETNSLYTTIIVYDILSEDVLIWGEGNKTCYSEVYHGSKGNERINYYKGGFTPVCFGTTEEDLKNLGLKIKKLSNFK